MNCEDARVLLHALLDDELDVAAGLDVTRHLAECPECEQRFQRHAQLRADIRAVGLYRPAPAALRARITAQLPRTSRASRPMPRGWSFALAALAALFVIAAVLAGWETAQLRGRNTDTLAMEAVSAHLRSLLPGHLIDVPTSDQHTVKPWFNGRLDFSPQVKDLSADGFELAGGRLDVLAGKQVAAIVYRRRLHVIDLFEWPAANAAPTGTLNRNGYHVVQWNEGGMRFVAVSDVAEADLDDFMRAFKAGPTVASEPAH